MYEILDTTPDIDPASQEGTEPPPGGAGEIEFRGVRFRYPSRMDVPLFEDLDLLIPGGKTTALVGESGSGKSTVVGLIQRFYDVQKGSVTMDGVDLKELKLGWLRKTLGLVSQEPVLFATSIMNNIRYGSCHLSSNPAHVASITAHNRAAWPQGGWTRRTRR